MRRNKKELKDFIQLCFVVLILVLILGLPNSAKEGLRGSIAAICAPIWSTNAWAADKLSSDTKSNVSQESYQFLELENIRLRQELKGALETIVQQRTLLRESGKIKSKADLQTFLTEQEEKSAQLLTGLSQMTPADIIYRDPSSWSSFVWVNVGSNENDKQGSTLIGKNSPVVVGTTLIGVVDYVGTRQSRVRLITDAGLNPAVRVARGQIQNYALFSSIDDLQEKLSLRRDLFPDTELLKGIYYDLSTLKDYVEQATSTTYLAKGFVYGSSDPLWRSKKPLLKGEGFNYDFADTYGPSRDLFEGSSTDQKAPLVQEGDLLITSGLDSLFPEGLKVGHVTHVYPLEEGDTSFELEIAPEVSDFYELSRVYLLPPYQNNLSYLNSN